jgi:formate-dependent nitrite reductase membrane component NrfD
VIEARNRSDGRGIDPSLATLEGEAARQRAGSVEENLRSIAQVWEQLPVPNPNDPTYYDRPMLKEPVWKPYIPLYFYIGGAAGASLALGAAAQLDGSRKLDGMIRRAHWIGIAGSTIGAALLIADLGRPIRFLYMLRVFRPTSPMNMGVWILAATPPAAITAGLLTRRNAALREIGEAAGYVAGVCGLGLATYTGVLLAGSAVPIWQESRKVLPVLFGASAVAAASSLLDLLHEDRRACAITRKYGIIGRAAELAAGAVLERQISRVPAVARPLKSGFTSVLWRGAAVLTAASLATLLIPKQNRRKRMIAGVLGSLGSLAMRFAIAEAGVRSARDPRASFHLQRGAASTS